VKYLYNGYIELGDNMRKITTDPFTKVMSHSNSAMAMDGASSKGFSKWVNKDIKQAAESGDWSMLMAKAQNSTRIFRNQFYR
jgi:hypothetical protein